MITIKNRVSKIKISNQKVKAAVQAMLDVAGYSDFDVGILFTTDSTIRKYNKRYRKKDKPTDILSFPYHSDLKPGGKVVIFEPEDKNLGDMIISLEFSKKDAEAQNRSLMEHVHMLLAHGIAHLLGYDHQTEQQYKQMKRKEHQLLKALE